MNVAVGTPSSSNAVLDKLEIVQKAFLAPFNHKKTDSTRILSDRMWYSNFQILGIIGER